MWKKNKFLTQSLKLDVYVADEPFTFDINMFNEESQLVISLLSQFLGLDIDRFIPKILLSLLFNMSMC